MLLADLGYKEHTAACQGVRGGHAGREEKTRQASDAGFSPQREVLVWVSQTLLTWKQGIEGNSFTGEGQETRGRR